MIEIRDLEKSFGNKKVLDKINLEIPLGETTCIMAPSGYGKTTLFRILLGLEDKDNGKIIGLDSLKKSVVFQEDRLCSYLNSEQNIELVNMGLSKEEIYGAMKQVGIDQNDKAPVSTFSGGMKRRVSILRAVLYDYDILFLDEPFKGLDENTKENVAEFIRSSTKGKTVLLITHDKKEGELLRANNWKIIH